MWNELNCKLIKCKKIKFAVIITVETNVGHLMAL